MFIYIHIEELGMAKRENSWRQKLGKVIVANIVKKVRENVPVIPEDLSASIRVRRGIAHEVHGQGCKEKTPSSLE